jgi:inner membrane protein
MDKRAMFYGAMAQSVPDIDFVMGFFLHGAENICAHRGITHSVLFGLSATLFLAGLVKKVIHKTPLSYKTVLLLFGINIFTHLFIDTFNAYGVGLLIPFSDHRFTLNLLYVADPLFSIAPFVSFLALLFLNKAHKRRVLWIRTGIAISALYLCMAVFNKWTVSKAAQKNLAEQNKGSEFFTTPSPFNSLLWFIVAKDSLGYYTSYRSVFDTGRMTFTYFPRNDSLANQVTNKKDLQLLKGFSQGYFTLEKWGDTTVLNVLRFGQVVGWYDAGERFAFYYYLNYPRENDLAVQRGRFLRWNKRSTAAFFKRMVGMNSK